MSQDSCVDTYGGGGWVWLRSISTIHILKQLGSVLLPAALHIHCTCTVLFHWKSQWPTMKVKGQGSIRCTDFCHKSIAD